MLVYLIRNRETGKGYVGITSKSLEQRWSQHCWTAKRGEGRALHRAIRRYGVDAFEVSVLESHENLDDLNAAEVRLISKLGTFIPQGYNLTLGGEGVLGCKGRKQPLGAVRKNSGLTQRTKTFGRDPRKDV